jgi:hypothetical protein
MSSVQLCAMPLVAYFRKEKKIKRRLSHQNPSSLLLLFVTAIVASLFHLPPSPSQRHRNKLDLSLHLGLLRLRIGLYFKGLATPSSINHYCRIKQTPTSLTKRFGVQSRWLGDYLRLTDGEQLLVEIENLMNKFD